MNNAIFDANVDATLVRNLWSRPITVGSEREPIDLNIVCRSVWKLLNDSRNASSRILETKVRLLKHGICKEMFMLLVAMNARTQWERHQLYTCWVYAKADLILRRNEFAMNETTIRNLKTVKENLRYKISVDVCI